MLPHGGEFTVISAVCPKNFCQPYYFFEESTATHSALTGQDMLI